MQVQSKESPRIHRESSSHVSSDTIHLSSDTMYRLVEAAPQIAFLRQRFENDAALFAGSWRGKLLALRTRFALFERSLALFLHPKNLLGSAYQPKDQRLKESLQSYKAAVTKLLSHDERFIKLRKEEALLRCSLRELFELRDAIRSSASDLRWGDDKKANEAVEVIATELQNHERTIENARRSEFKHSFQHLNTTSTTVSAEWKVASTSNGANDLGEDRSVLRSRVQGLSKDIERHIILRSTRCKIVVDSVMKVFHIAATFAARENHNRTRQP